MSAGPPLTDAQRNAPPWYTDPAELKKQMEWEAGQHPERLEIARQAAASNEAAKQAFAEGYLKILGLLTVAATAGALKGGAVEGAPNGSPNFQPVPQFGGGVPLDPSAYPEIDGLKFKFHRDDQGVGYVDLQGLGRAVRTGTTDLYRRDGGSRQMDMTAAVDVFRLADGREIVFAFDEATFKRSTYYTRDGKDNYTVICVPLDSKGLVQTDVTPLDKPAAPLAILDKLK